MSKNATVTKAEPTGRTWEGKNGTNYCHAIEFDNGDSGEYSSMSEAQTKFVVGKSAEYTIEDGGNYADKIKPPKQQGGGGYKGKTPEERRGINACNSLTNAVALASAGHVEAEEGKMAGKVLEVADFLFDWLESKHGDSK